MATYLTNALSHLKLGIRKRPPGKDAYQGEFRSYRG